MKKSGEWWVCDEERNMLKFTDVAKRGDPSWQGNFPLYLNYKILELIYSKFNLFFIL